MESFLEAWDLICDYCKKQVTDVSYETWFSKLVPISLDFGAGVAIIQAPNEFNKSTIERGFHKCLNDAVQSVFGEAFTYKLITPMEKKEKERVPDDDEYEYTFETFIEGSSNKFACAACRYVAKEPAKNYNPLFIYGNSGLGKTHLLNAIGHELKKNFPDKDIIYVKGDQFANELIEAIRAGTTVSFREKYRKADALLIDDIQFIAGKDSTQEEFFHTFNTLYESGKQIVLTSDRPPREMTQLSDRLMSRFESGLMVDVAPPDFETRLAIIHNKAALLGVKLPNEVMDYIAENVTTNVRQLEGTLNKILAYRDLLGDQVDEESVGRAVRDMLKRSNEYVPSPKVIISYICSYYNIDEETLRGQSRSRDVVAARQLAMYLIRRMHATSLDGIGKEFGNRDHSTILHSLDKVEKQMQTDPKFAERVKEITTNISSKR